MSTFNEEIMKQKVEAIEKSIAEAAEFGEQNGLDFSINPQSGCRGYISFESTWSSSWSSSNE
ncbi:hypothetical protein ACX818_001382 [Acinetobacter baumannii]